jgi:hypothetical protein
VEKFKKEAKKAVKEKAEGSSKKGSSAEKGSSAKRGEGSGGGADKAKRAAKEFLK